MTGSLACYAVRLARLARTGANRAKFEPLRAANRVKRRLGMAPDTAGIQQIGSLYFLYSLAAFLKHRVKNAVNYIENFERAVAREAKVRDVDGLVCGHIHRPTISTIDNKLYLNCGDWVESCTALLEHHDGSIELVHFSDRAESLEILSPVVAERAA